MKICQIVSHIDEEASGPSYSVPKLCENISLVDKDTELILCTLASRVKKNIDFSFEHLEFAEKKLFKRLGRSNSMKYWLKNKSSSFDLIHSHGLWMMPNIYPANYAFENKKKYVVSPRGTLSKQAMKYSRNIKNIFWEFLQKDALNKASAFHATSHDEYIDIRSAGFKVPVAIVPNGIEIPKTYTNVKTNEKRTLLYLGRIHPKKGLEDAIEAWSDIQNQFLNWEFLIVGKGDEKYIRKLKSLIKIKNIKNIIFSGPIYGEEKNKVYQRSDVFILPTKSENFGMVVAEALSNSVPVLTTTGAPWRGLIDNRAGWWIDPKKEEIKKTLIKVLKMHSDELAEFGSNGRAWMEEEFSWKNIASDMISFYKWLNNQENEVPSFVKID